MRTKMIDPPRYTAKRQTEGASNPWGLFDNFTQEFVAFEAFPSSDAAIAAARRYNTAYERTWSN